MVSVSETANLLEEDKIMFGLFNKKKKPKNALEGMIHALYGNPPPRAQRADLSDAINLAHTDLLSEIVDKSEVKADAEALFNGEIPYTTQDLALSVALNFYKKAKYTSGLAGAQMLARMTVLGWLEEGLVVPILVKTFEDELYVLYK